MRFDVDDRVELQHCQRAIADHILRWGRDAVPAALPRLVLQIKRELMSPFDANSVADRVHDEHAETMSYTEARTRLGISRRTMSRRVATHAIDVRGRRVIAASVDEYLAPGSGYRPPRNRAGRERG